RDRIAAVTRAVFFGLLCLPFPLIWMQGNEVALGSPFAPIHHIDEFHRAWVAEGLARWGPVLYRLQNLFFWPGIAVVTLSPLVAFFGIAGIFRAWKQRPQQRWLIWTILIPTAYFTARSAILLNFQPLGRFAATQVALVLPYVWYGFESLTERASSTWKRALAILSVATAVGLPVGLGLFTTQSEHKLAKSLRPIGPISKNPEAVRQVVQFIKERAKTEGAGIILDTDPQYSDMQIAFFSGLPEEKMARYRWDTFQKRLLTAQPAYLIRIDGGLLAENLDFGLEGSRARLGDRWFEEVPGVQRPFPFDRPLRGRSSAAAIALAEEFTLPILHRRFMAAHVRAEDMSSVVAGDKVQIRAVVGSQCGLQGGGTRGGNRAWREPIGGVGVVGVLGSEILRSDVVDVHAADQLHRVQDRRVGRQAHV